jgi:hypothetical protein
MVGLTKNRSLQDEKLIETIFLSHSQARGTLKKNLIIDARPTANAVANVAKGAGTEAMENYKSATKVHMGIDNIHVMRDSLYRLTEGCLRLISLDNEVTSECSTFFGTAPQSNQAYKYKV